MASPTPSQQRSRRSRQYSEDLQISTPTRESHVNGLPPPTTQGSEKKSSAEKMLPNGGVAAAGESGRRGIHPFHFAKVVLRSSSKAALLCNVLWPAVPAALAVRYTLPEKHVLIFILAYIAMIPCANLVGFAGQELGRKLPHVMAVLIETTTGSIVEIILFQLLLSKDYYEVVKAAILGSILATMLLCLGLCFFVGGLGKHEQVFSEAVSEVGSGLLLTAGVALAIPSAFYYALLSSTSRTFTVEHLEDNSIQIARIICVLLIISYAVYIFFQARTHHGIYSGVFEEDEERDRDRDEDLAKAKLTMTECIIALVISVTLVTFIALTLVLQIEPIIGPQISDAFMGLILVPLVEKFAEHLTAIDECYDNQTSLAMAHVLGATLQTALFNGPLTVIVGWGLNKPMDLNFEIFNIIMLILAILTVGRFLQDKKSNYLEGFLLVMLYIAIAVAAFYYPNPQQSEGGKGETASERRR